MKKPFLLLTVCLFCVAAHAQIKIGNTAKPVPVVGPYDSLSNYLGSEIARYVGQQLYVKPLPEKLRKYGYEGFYNSLQNVDVYCRSEENARGSEYNELVNKTFTVVSVEKRALGSYEPSRYLLESDSEHIYYLKLTNSAGNIVYYKYPNNEYFFPFVVVGYFDKLKQNIGRKYYRKGAADDTSTDYRSGLSISPVPGTLWRIADVVLNDLTLDDFLFIFENEKGEQISANVDYVTSSYVEKPQADKLKAKYGTLYATAMQCKVKVGMTKELVRLAWGEPETINKSSYNEQWVYGGQYVYFKNGVVTAYN